MEEVLAKYFSGEASKDEISLVNSWRAESETNAEAFFDAKKIWLEARPLDEAPTHILNDILEQPQAKQVPFILRSWVKYASAAILVLAISLIFILNKEGAGSNVRIQDLADGSTIALHEQSEVKILNFTENVREVIVSGKAYFDIKRDESRPFIIHTGNAQVKVLGTSFVVDSYGPKTEVCVESGLVELSKIVDGSNVAVKLGEGEMGLVADSNTGIIKKNNGDVNYLAWKTKVITFDESSMSEVKEVLEDVYGIKLEFENPAFKECKLTAKFNKKRAKDALEIISRTFGIQYDFSNKKAVLKGKGC